MMKIAKNVFENYKCNTCEKEAKSIIELMNHKKEYHPLTVNGCKKFKLNQCFRTNEQCWFSHEQSSQQISEKMDFQKVLTRPKPPELNLYSMLQEIMTKLEKLEQK